MRGHQIIGIVCALLVAACASEPRPHWSPNIPPRSEDWHTGNMMIANFDTNNDGTVTRRELEAGLRQNFRQADINRDGRLDPEEAAAANQRRIKFDESTAMPLIDWNQDGFIDFDEFCAGVRSQFEQLDTDGDGQVTINEFRHAPHQ
jgi:Ca2+-binding EF-hand superfamily protein